MQQRGFTLLELVIAIAIASFATVMISSMGRSKPADTNAECIVSTRAQLNYIRARIESFARANDRLPMPAQRNVGADSPVFGREAAAADITFYRPILPGPTIPGSYWGALPFQSLDLPVSFGADCWGNKFTYVVSELMVTKASFADTTHLGNFSLLNADKTKVKDRLAYVVISHGPDGLGATKMNYSGSNHGWCSVGGKSVVMDIARYNCSAGTIGFVDAIYNDGKDAGAAYFDDIIIAGAKPAVL